MPRSLFIFISFFITYPLFAAPTAEELISGMENLMWGKTTHTNFNMTIKTQYWERKLELEAWLDRPQKTLIRIHTPKKEKGVGSLRIGGEMWNYIPKIDRTLKIPPSMMLQPWMGSDFSNDDLVKESSMVNDYRHEIADSVIEEGKTIFRVISIPKSGAPVVWGKLEFLIYSDFIPLQQTFFDDSAKVVKVMKYSDIREIGGRTIPVRWRMLPADKPDQFTEIIVNDIDFDKPLNEALFSLRTLRNPQ